MDFLTARWRSQAAVALMFTMFIALHGCTRASEQASESTGLGKGTITSLHANHPASSICHVPVSDVDLGALDIGCRMGHPKYIYFTEVSSAATIRFIGDKYAENCEGNSPIWSVEFKSRGVYTSDPENPWNIQQLLSKAESGAIIDRNFTAGEVTGTSDLPPSYDYPNKLSCIQIRDGHGVTNIPVATGSTPGTDTRDQGAAARPAAVANVANVSTDYGRIVLTDVNNRTCYLPITGADIRKERPRDWIPGCGDGFTEIRTIQLEDVPSALSIYVRSFSYIPPYPNPDPDPAPTVFSDCDLQSVHSYAFRIEIKTTGRITGLSDAFNIDKIIATPPNSAVIENLRLVSYARLMGFPHYPTNYYFACFKFNLGNT